MRPLTTILDASLRRQTPINTPETRTYGWVTAHTDEKDIFATEWDGRFYLYTKRKVFRLIKAQNPNVFKSWLKQTQVTYIVQYPIEESDDILLAQIMKQDAQFQKVFEDLGERTVIYRFRN